MIVDISEQDFGTICICAIRYCQGRQSYMPSLVQRIVKEHLSCISDNTLRVMAEDCKFQKNMDLYGDDMIDKPGWIAWEEMIREEIRKREETKQKEGEV